MVYSYVSHVRNSMHSEIVFCKVSERRTKSLAFEAAALFAYFFAAISNALNSLFADYRAR